MVWGAFSSYGTLSLAFPSCKMKSEEYQEVLEENLLPYLHQFSEFDLIFQQDNASVHVSRSTKAFFEAHNVTVLKWPACSPDLNPVENIWGWLVQQVYRDNTQYSSLGELRTAIEVAWAQITPDFLRNYWTSMNNRLFNVIHKNGAAIDY